MIEGAWWRKWVFFYVPMTLFRGLHDDVTLNDWLYKYIFPAEKKNVTEDLVRWGTRLAAAEQIRSGVTTPTSRPWSHTVTIGAGLVESAAIVSSCGLARPRRLNGMVNSARCVLQR